jgi:fructokinase
MSNFDKRNYNMENTIVVGMGEALWDVLPEGKKIGGAPANFAYHVSQFGLNSRVVSAVGDDKLGMEILDNFREKKLNAMVEIVPYPTGTVQVELDDEGVPCYDIKEGVAWDNIPYTPALEDLAKHTKAVCFGSLAQRSVVSRETINRFLDAMSTENTLKIFDINLRQGFYTKEILCNSFRKCNVLKINDEELVTVSRMFGYPGIDLQDKCWILLAKYNLKMLILTCGVNGSYVFTPGDVSFVETPKVEVADTVGAGDSFTAAFVASILSGLSIGEAHKLAVETSAYVCTQNGAMPVLPESLKERVIK